MVSAIALALVIQSLWFKGQVGETLIKLMLKLGLKTDKVNFRNALLHFMHEVIEKYYDGFGVSLRHITNLK